MYTIVYYYHTLKKKFSESPSDKLWSLWIDKNKILKQDSFREVIGEYNSLDNLVSLSFCKAETMPVEKKAIGHYITCEYQRKRTETLLAVATAEGKSSHSGKLKAGKQVSHFPRR